MPASISLLNLNGLNYKGLSLRNKFHTQITIFHHYKMMSQTSSNPSKKRLFKDPKSEELYLVMYSNFYYFRRNMSANVSGSSLSPKKPQVIAFHSSAKWKIHFEASKETNKLIIIDFTASWCGPCRYIEPAIYELAAKYTDVEFVKIDVDELDDVAQEFGVQAMPTFVVIKKGKEVDKIVGARKEELQKKIEQHRVQSYLM